VAVPALTLLASCTTEAPTDSALPPDVPTTTPVAEEAVPTTAPTIEDPPAPQPSPPAGVTPTAEPTPAPPTPATSLDGLALAFDTVIDLDDVPLAVAPHPDGESLIVAEKSGVLARWTPQPDGTYDRAEPALLDLRGRTSTGNEQGLLGLAVAPDGRYLYIVYTDLDGSNRLVELTIDGTERRELLVVQQPFPNHNGGHLAFGPDGYLYYGLGDGGSAGDPLATGQDPSDLLGSILRIAPDPDGDTYAIPADNPFVDRTDARAEVFAYGLRNPWRFSFDPATGDLWIGDVGQGSIEEVDLLRRLDGTAAGSGANLGWSAFEGTVPFGVGNPTDAVEPISQYTHDEGCSITGGVVARGTDPALEGVYLYADYCRRWIRGLIVSDGSVDVVSEAELGSVESNPVSFGVGHAGQVFVLLESGEIQRITVS
jgi:glucose/arabinose dehydrogenase